MFIKNRDSDGAASLLALTFGLQVLIFMAVNALSGLNQIDVDMGAGVRTILHLFPGLAILLIGFIYGVNGFVFRGKGWSLRILVVGLSFSLVVISVVANHSEAGHFFKVFVFFVHLLNVVFVIPLILSVVDYRFFVVRFSSFYCFSVILLSVLVFYLYFSGGSPYARVGYPFIPGVYSYMSVVAFGLSIFVLKSWAMALFFAFAIFLSGSRAGVVLGVVIVGILFFSNYSWKSVFLTFLGIFSVFLIWEGVGNYSKPYTIDRIDVTSGRSDIWGAALDMIKDSPVIGYSREITFGKNEYGESLVAHNSFIDLSLSYGVIFAFLAYVFWGMLFFSAWNRRVKWFDRAIIFTAFFVVLAKSLISNVFWTNMGDGVTYAALILLCAAVHSKRHKNEFASA